MTKFLDNLALGVLVSVGLLAVVVVSAIIIKNVWILALLALSCLFGWAFARLITK